MKIAILGGGQLATMLTDAVARLGGETIVVDPSAEAPARTRATEFVAAPFGDVGALRGVLARADVATFDREDLPVDVLREAGRGARFVPSIDVLAIAQDRTREKELFARAGIPCARNVTVEDGASLADAAEAFGFPAIAKTTRGGYDGRGQARLASRDDAERAARAAPGASWIVEELLPITTEASCIVARTETEEACFPIVENVHRDHVLDRALVPARLTPEIERTVIDVALRCARAIDARGLLCVETFVTTRRGRLEVLANEIAPRPHNSGHVLTRACNFGQFEALARALVGAPLGKPELLPGAWCMGNLLADVWIAQGSSGPLGLASWREFPDVCDVHVYGKRPSSPRRKMGHFVVRAATSDVALARAEGFRDALRSGVVSHEHATRSVR